MQHMIGFYKRNSTKRTEKDNIGKASLVRMENGSGNSYHRLYIRNLLMPLMLMLIPILPQAQTLTLTAVANQIQCHGGTGSVILTASGGTGPYTYGSEPTTNLSPGTYNFSVSDGTSTAYASATINAAPAELAIAATTVQPLCFGQTGSITLTTSGGTQPHTLDPGNPATTGLAAGSYTYRVTDANGCTDQVTVTINTAPAELVLTATPTQPKCFGELGSVALTATGGNGAYAYGGAATSNLAAGTYNYTVTDANGCTANTSAVIDAAPAQLVLTATPTQPKCFGELGSVALSATGGTGPYTYGGAATVNLTAGTYNYTVTDANGCTANASATINAAPAQLVLTATPTQPKCYGELGSVALLATGGTATYTYSDDATTNLAAGTYNYTVTDANGCTAVRQVLPTPGPTATQQ